MADFVRYYVGDIVQMKKAHPCGCNEWEVLRIGVDFVTAALAAATGS